MKPLDTNHSGVPTTDTESMAQWAPAKPAGVTSQHALPDVTLPQLPPDAGPVTPPEFVLAQKVSEQAPAGATIPAGMPGVITPHTQDPSLGGMSPGLDPGHPPVPEPVAGVLTGADHALDQAQHALSGAAPPAGGPPGGPGGAPAAPAVAGVPGAPAMPPDPVGVLLHGGSLPGLPGVEVLFAPIRQLMQSFGTGKMPAVDPTAILSQSSQAIQAAMQIGKGATSTLGQAWQSNASQTAQQASQKAQQSGNETSQRGIDIGDVTRRAASTVEYGNAQLTAVASSFVGQATALAPVILTPPAQAVLLASATEHLGQAMNIVGATRADLAGKTAELGAMVQQLIGPQLEKAAQTAGQAAGPVAQQAQSLVGSLAGKSPSEDPSATTDAGSPSTTTAGLSPQGLGGAPGGLGSSGAPGGPSGFGAPDAPGAPATPGSPPPPGLMPQAPPAAGAKPAAPGTPAAPGGAPPGSVMGGAHAPGGHGKDDDHEHQRSVADHHKRTGTDELTGLLHNTSPEVVGAPPGEETVIFDTDYGPR